MKKLLFLILISFSTIFAKEKDNRELIKAYDKGKPAKIDIEITKLKSNNFIDFTIDRINKKLYKDITKASIENNFLENSMYITNSIKKSYGYDYNIKDIIPYKILFDNDKKFLEIDYSKIKEPNKIYLWILKGGKLHKLYTGIISKEYFDPENPLSYINMNLTKVIDDKKNKILEQDTNKVKFKIAEIVIANLKERNLKNKDILLKLSKKYKVINENNKEIKEIELFFSNNEKQINLNEDNNLIYIWGKLEKKIIDNKKIFISEINSTNNEFQINLSKLSKSNKKDYKYLFKNYFFNNNTNQTEKDKIYVSQNGSHDEYELGFEFKDNKLIFVTDNINSTPANKEITCPNHNPIDKNKCFDPIINLIVEYEKNGNIISESIDSNDGYIDEDIIDKEDIEVDVEVDIHDDDDFFEFEIDGENESDANEAFKNMKRIILTITWKCGGTNEIEIIFDHNSHDKIEIIFPNFNFGIFNYNVPKINTKFKKIQIRNSGNNDFEVTLSNIKAPDNSSKLVFTSLETEIKKFEKDIENKEKDKLKIIFQIDLKKKNTIIDHIEYPIKGVLEYKNENTGKYTGYIHATVKIKNKKGGKF